MKLWMKISAVCVAVLLVVVCIIGALFLYTARNNVLELTVDNAKDKQQYLARSFANTTAYYTLNGASEQATEALALYCFSTFADETSVLVQHDATLYSFVPVEPQRILPLSSEQQRVFLDEIGKRNLLIVGSLVTVLGYDDPFSVYVVTDITENYQAYTTMATKLTVIAAIGILLGAILIVSLVRATSRPLKALGLTAGRIASGHYDERAKAGTHDEIGALAVDFNRMADAIQTHIAALEEKTARQQAFIGGLTHEFKTPMTSMMLHSETLLSASLTEEQRENSLSHIHTQCAWLERLTQKLMSLITLGEDIKKRDTSVAELFERVTESTAENMAKRETALTTSTDVETLNMDIDLMQSLLVNLVDNASKASEKGQTIELTAVGRTITVRDRGRGIPADAIARVTEPFYMVDKSRSKSQGGSGLGLALAKRIADAHGAEMRIESTAGQGTVISVTLP